MASDAIGCFCIDGEKIRISDDVGADRCALSPAGHLDGQDQKKY